MSRHALDIGTRSLLAALSLAVLVACGAHTLAAPGAPLAAARLHDHPAWPAAAVANPTTLGFTADGLQALEARMKQAVDNKEIAGINYALVKDGEVAAFEAVGSQILGGSPMRDNTLFRIRSTGKTITAVAMMQLWDQGKWRLDDPITKYLPELANLKVATSPDNLDTLVPASHIPTMHEVMTHTAGFSYGLRTDIAADRAYRAADVLRAKDMKTFVSQVASLPLANQPGERWYCSPRLVTAHTRNAIGAMRGVLGGPGYGFGYGGRVVVDGSTETTPQPNGAFSHFSIDGCWFWVDPTNKLSFVGLIARRGGGPVGGVTMGGEGDAARLVYRALAK